MLYVMGASHMPIMILIRAESRMQWKLHVRFGGGFTVLLRENFISLRDTKLGSYASTPRTELAT